MSRPPATTSSHRVRPSAPRSTGSTKRRQPRGSRAGAGRRPSHGGRCDRHSVEHRNKYDDPWHDHYFDDRPAATVQRVKQAEDELAKTSQGITAATPLAEATAEYNSAAFALQISWMKLISNAGCLSDEQQAEAVAQVTAYTANLQTQLQQVGFYDGQIDGIYGPQTVDGVKRLQAESKLPETGFVDQATAQALDKKLAAAGRQAAIADTTQTATVQTVLTLTGFWTAPVDGVWTDGYAALQAFQTKLGVEPTGVVDAPTLAAFEQSGCHRRPDHHNDHNASRNHSRAATAADRCTPDRADTPGPRPAEIRASRIARRERTTTWPSTHCWVVRLTPTYVTVIRTCRKRPPGGRRRGHRPRHDIATDLVEYLVLVLPGLGEVASIADELTLAVASSAIRILDMVVISVDADGAAEVIDAGSIESLVPLKRDSVRRRAAQSTRHRTGCTSPPSTQRGNRHRR